jgi:hypothetical protein
MGLMKKETLSFTVKQPKHRAHNVLFCRNTPFTPKVVKPKNGYKRKNKHPKRVEI